MSDVRRVLDANDFLGETPLWCRRTSSLWWIDVEAPRLHRYVPASGVHDVFPIAARFVGSVAFRRDGGLLLALDLGLHFFDPATGALTPVREVEPKSPENRLNDGRCDAQGRLWIGTMDKGLTRPSGSFYRVDPDGTVTRLFGDIIVSNTVAIAPDQRTLYFSDTRRFITWAFDLHVDVGRLENRRIFVDHTARRDRPDGAAVDAEGFVWTAIFGGARIDRYAPDGRLDRSIPLPVTNPTCLAFGGEDLRTLYITTARKFLTPEQLAAEPLAGALLAVDVGVRGIEEARFAA